MEPAKLTVLTALAAEADALTRCARKPDSTAALADKERNTDKSVTSVVQCGIGSHTLFNEAIRHLKKTNIVGNIGVCGGLAPDLKPGTIIIVDQIAVRFKNIANFQEQYVPDEEIVEFLSQILANNGIEYRHGTLLCSEEALITPEEKALAFSTTSAIAVDMESAGAAEAARQACLPFFCVKVVCDTAQMEVVKELLDAVDSRGNNKPTRLILPLLKRPWLGIQIWHMARHFGQAISGIQLFWEIAQTPLLQYIEGRKSLSRPTHGDFEGP